MLNCRSFNSSVSSTSSSFGFDGSGESGGLEMPISPEFFGTLSRETISTDETLEKPVLEKINRAMVTGSFFETYALRAKYGDVFSDAGDNSGTPGVVLGATLAGKIYKSIISLDQLLGKKIILNNSTYTIIGILENDVWNSSGRNVSFNEMAFFPMYAMRSASTAVQQSVTASLSVPLAKWFSVGVHGVTDAESITGALTLTLSPMAKPDTLTEFA